MLASSLNGACVGWKHCGIHEARVILRNDVKKGIVLIIKIIPKWIQVSQSKIAIGNAPTPVEMEKSVDVVSIADERVGTTT